MMLVMVAAAFMAKLAADLPRAHAAEALSRENAIILSTAPCQRQRRKRESRPSFFCSIVGRAITVRCRVGGGALDCSRADLVRRWNWTCGFPHAAFMIGLG
jgi:hypothetical protein